MTRKCLLTNTLFLPWPHHKTRFCFALVLALRLQPGAFCMIATVCSSWVFLSRSTCLGWILQPFYAVMVGLGVGRSNCEQTYTKTIWLNMCVVYWDQIMNKHTQNLSSWNMCAIYWLIHRPPAQDREIGMEPFGCSHSSHGGRCKRNFLQPG